MGKGATSAGVFGFVVGSALTALAFAAYNLSKRTKRGSSLFQRTLSSSYAATSTGDNVSFLTDMIQALWPHIKVAAAEKIRAKVLAKAGGSSGHGGNSSSSSSTTISFTKLDLGQTPVRFDNVVVHELQGGVVQFDVDLIWDSDCDVRLRAYQMSLGIRAIKLCGRMVLLLGPCTDELPCVSAVQYAFTNVPRLELSFTGLAQIANAAVLQTRIRTLLLDAIQEVAALPHRMLYRLNEDAAACRLTDIYTAPIGVARIAAVRGEGFVIERGVFVDDIPDVYLILTLGNATCRTTTVVDSLCPSWNGETSDFVLYDYDQLLVLHAWDEDNGALDPDDYLGTARITVGDLLLARGSTKTLALGHQDENMAPTGASVTISCDVLPFSSALSSLCDSGGSGEGGAPASNHTISGILTVFVLRAFNLPSPASSFVTVKYGTAEFVTSVIAQEPGVDAANPVYDFYCDIPIVAPSGASVELTLFTTATTATAATPVKLGTISVKHDTLVRNSNASSSAASPNGTKICNEAVLGTISSGGASLEYGVLLKGVRKVTKSLSSKTIVAADPEASILATESSTTTTTVDEENAAPTKSPRAAIGAARLTVVKGRGFVIQKRRLRKSDIPDVYCCLAVGTSKWRTTTVMDSTTPVWNQAFDFGVASHGHYVTIDAWDQDKGSNDEKLGSARITVGKLLLAGGGGVDVALERNGKATGEIVTLRCEMV